MWILHQANSWVIVEMKGLVPKVLSEKLANSPLFGFLLLIRDQPKVVQWLEPVMKMNDTQYYYVLLYAL